MRRAGGAAALLLLAACEMTTPPPRAETYGFAIDCGIPNFCSEAAGEDLILIFRWPPSALPVRVWVDPRGDLPVFVRAGIQAWEQVALYGEIRAVLVRDSLSADVIVRLGEPRAITGTDGLAPLACRGQTDIQIGLDTAIVLPFHTNLTPRSGSSGPEVSECFQIAALHELGHAFGLFLHSDTTSDVMHGRPTTPNLSHRDVDTFTRLYHTLPTVRLPADR